MTALASNCCIDTFVGQIQFRGCRLLFVTAIRELIRNVLKNEKKIPNQNEIKITRRLNWTIKSDDISDSVINRRQCR